MIDDLSLLPAPTTYEEAEAILRELSRAHADSLWSDFSHQEAESLMQSFAPNSVTSAVPITESAETACPSPFAALEEGVEDGRSLPRLSETTLLDVLETAPDGVVVIDGRGTIVLVNAQTERLFGYTRSELVGKKVELLVPIRIRDSHVAMRRGYFAAPHLRAMGQTGKPLFGLRKDGREFPVEISLSPLRTEHGLLVTSTIRDVTERNRLEIERKQREGEIAKAEARYRSLVEEIPAVTFVAPFDESIGELYVSPQIVNLLGFTQEEWLNDPVLWHRQLHPEDRERWHSEFARTCATARPFRAVYRFIARDGRIVWVHGEAKVVRDQEGRPIFLQGVAFDITERKEAEEKLRQLNQTLNERVAARTEDLKRSNEALSDYGYYMAHQIKKPIGRINDIINGPLLKSHANDPPEVRLANIQRVAGDMEKLVLGLLKYALVTDKANKFGPTDCGAIVAEVRDELRADIETVGAGVSFDHLPTVIAHRESLKTVFFNLIENAIKYRGLKPLQIHVASELHRGQWRFRVIDNGMGIPKHPDLPPGLGIDIAASINYHKSIFAFGGRYHSNDRHGNKIAGHGIGLSYCQKVLEHHGGTIWVESEENQGSTFFFTLPAANA